MRVFLFLLLIIITTAAAAQPIQCVYEEYSPVDARVRYDSPYRLVRIPRPRVKGMTRTRIGDVTIYTRRDSTEWDAYLLNVIAERGGTWFQLRDETGLPMVAGGTFVMPETEKPPVVTRAKRGLPVVRVSWIAQWGSPGGLTRNTVLLDFRAKPRVLVSIDCSDVSGRGACTGPETAHMTHTELRCDDALRCRMREYVNLDWTTRSATRTFDLLTNEPLPPSRFDATTYASGAAFAAAPAAVRQRALIDGVGLVQPVYQVSPGTVLFAAPAFEPIAGLRFFLLRRGTWREIPLTLLTDALYPGDEDDVRERAGSISPGFTPDGPQFVLSAWDLELPGKTRTPRGKAIEVIATEGIGRSLYWILLDPGGRTGALRVATDQPEWRHCGNYVFPLSMTTLGIPESGLPAIATGIASWRLWDLKDGKIQPTCNVSGTIDWSAKRGWIVKLAAEPCTDPIPRPFKATINDNGYVGVEAVPVPR